MTTVPIVWVLANVEPGDQDWSWRSQFRWLEEHHAVDLDALKRDMRDAGQRDPIVIGGDGRLWDGHHRLYCAVKLGWSEVQAEAAGADEGWVALLDAVSDTPPPLVVSPAEGLPAEARERLRRGAERWAQDVEQKPTGPAGPPPCGEECTRDGWCLRCIDIRAAAPVAVSGAGVAAAVLSDAERAMLTYALGVAQDHILSRDGFTDEDQQAVDSLRRLTTAPATDDQP